jgi:hypothetical protein
MTFTELQELQLAMSGVIIEAPVRLRNKIPPVVATGMQ